MTQKLPPILMTIVILNPLQLLSGNRIRSYLVFGSDHDITIDGLYARIWPTETPHPNGTVIVNSMSARDIDACKVPPEWAHY